MKKAVLVVLSMLILVCGALFFTACQSTETEGGTDWTDPTDEGEDDVKFSIVEVIFQNGEESFSVKVVKGQQCAEPKRPQDTEDAVFLGWYQGEELYDFSLPVEETFTLTARFAGRPEGTLTGTVVDTDGKALAGATVTAGNKKTETDVYGRYGLNVAPSEACRIQISAQGYDRTIAWLAPDSQAREYNAVLRPCGSAVREPSEKADLQIDLNSYITVKLNRGETALQVKFEVLDSDITTYAYSDNNDYVTKGDRVEFYIDTLGDGGTFPQPDDWQINIDAEGYYRFVRGSGSVWLYMNNFIEYKVTRCEDKNGNSIGYVTEMSLPYDSFGITAKSDIHFTLGQSGFGTEKSASHWVGWTYDGQFSDPQIPAKYRVWQEDGTILVTQSRPLEIDGKYFEDLASIDAEKKSLTTRGEMMFTDDVKNMLGENLPEEFIGKTSFVLSQSSGASWSVSKAGYVILFAPAVGYRTLNETLAEDGWQLLCENGVSIGRDTCYFIDFALNNVYVRYCEAGEKFTYGTWTLAFGAADPDKEYYVFSYDKPESMRIVRSEAEDETVLYNGVASSVAVNRDVFVVIHGTGGRWEPDTGNYLRVRVSYDRGQSFVMAFSIRSDDPTIRYTDPFMYVNSDGVLIIAFNQTNVYFSGHCKRFQICVTNPTDPVADWEIGEPYISMEGISMNKPLEMPDGSLLLSVEQLNDINYSYIYRSTDKGLTWQLYSKAYLGYRTATFAHEGNLVRLPNGKLWLLVRATSAAYYECYSSDGGLTWTTGQASTLVGAKSRASLQNIPGSDKLLFISNAESMIRGNLTAYILTNNGTGPEIEGSLLLDARGGAGAAGVAYPDATIFSGGDIFITWDYDRIGEGSILGCYINVSDIMAGGTLSEDRIFRITCNTQ